MIVIHIGIPMYPVKDSPERGEVFSNIGFWIIFGIPNKLNWSITIDTFVVLHLTVSLYSIRTEMEAEIKSIQRFLPHLWHFLKLAKIGHIA